MKEVSNLSQKEAQESLERYCQSALKNNKTQGMDWAFGAVDFAFYVGLITNKQREELFEKYHFLE